MGGSKFLKRTLAIVLAASTMLTQMSFTDFGLMTVRAEEADAEGSWVKTSYITNGDFEDGTNGWTFETDAVTATKTDTWATNNKTNFLNIYTATDNTPFSMTQDITLPAGKYYFTIDNEGVNHTANLTASVGDKAEKLLAATTGWDKWTTNTSDVFTLTEGATLTFKVSGTLTNVTVSGKTEYWADLDNIVLYQWQLPPEYSYSDLETLIASVPADYAAMGFTSDSLAALTVALEAANNCQESSANEDIAAAYEALAVALDGLVFDADIFVHKVSDYDKNSIRGVDVSSYIAIMDSFDELNESISDPAKKLGFRDWNGTLLDRQGFFDLLADSGVNYIRLRLWNNPYDSDGNGYGGGNNDLAKTIEMGQYATEAGMQVLVDFHFSDFWADPSKQKAPKAWANYTNNQKADAISKMVTDTLTALVTDNNVAVGMVQIGNETNSRISSETDMNPLFDAGCDAVHAFNDAKGTSILAAVHFTDPHKGNYDSRAAGLAAYNDGEGVSYDVFASSYYPFWHGTMENLTTELNKIASTYGKYVMVAETSWAYTYEDGDGHENTIKQGSSLGSVNYGLSVQDQATEVRDVINAVNNVTAKVNGEKAGLGVFYWEPAWIPVQYAYDSNGTLDSSILDSNKALWERFGSGWASSYASEYDPDDAGKWYGGSSWDNQAMFDFNGNPLSSLNVYKYAIYGSVAPLSVSSYKCDSVTVEIGSEFTSASLPAATVYFNDSTSAEYEVTWSNDDISAVASKILTPIGVGTYTINGFCDVDGTPLAVQCTVIAVPKNILSDSGFEDSTGDWSTTGNNRTGDNSKKIITVNAKDDPRTGNRSTHFYNGSDFDEYISQTVTVDADGYYKASIYLQGDYGSGATGNIYLSVTNDTKTETYNSSPVSLSGWKNWQCPTIENIYAETGDTLTFTLHIAAGGGTWGTIDDASLYFYSDKILALSDDSVSLEYGKDYQLTAIHSYTPEDDSIIWESTDSSIISVDNTGKIIANGIGSATITATTGDQYALSASCTVTVTKRDLSTAVIDLGSYTYDRTAKRPADTSITIDGKTLTAGTDYTVDSYSDNTDAGPASVVITGIGDRYTGTTTATFTINKASLKGAVITLGTSSYIYDGTDKKPTVTSVTVGGKNLTTNDYEISGYTNNRNAGTATVTIKAKGSNYQDSTTKTFTIAKASKKISAKKTSVSKKYGDKAFKLDISVPAGEKMTCTSNRTKVVKVDNNGKVTIVGCGTATITVKSAASTNYNAAKDVKITVTVAPKKASISSVSSKKSKQMTVTWKKDTAVTGYQICYSTDSKFKKSKTVIIKSSKTTSKTIKNLTKGKKYYAKIRSYTTVGGKTVYGAYSKVKSTTVKK